MVLLIHVCQTIPRVQAEFSFRPKAPVAETKCCVVCSRPLSHHSEHAYMRAPCNHVYCVSCLRAKVEAVVEELNEESFPLTCSCEEPLQLYEVFPLVSDVLARRFRVRFSRR